MSAEKSNKWGMVFALGYGFLLGGLFGIFGTVNKFLPHLQAEAEKAQACDGVASATAVKIQERRPSPM